MVCLGENIESRYSNERYCSYYGLIFIIWKYNAVNKNWMWPQNWLRQSGNVFVFTFTKHLLKRWDVLHIKCLVEKVINHIVLMGPIGLNVKQVKQKPLKVCITSKVIGFLEFYIFPNMNILYEQSCLPSTLLLGSTQFCLFWKGISLRTAWVCLAFYLKPPLLDSLHHMVITSFYTNWSIWIQLEKGRDGVKLGWG